MAKIIIGLGVLIIVGFGLWWTGMFSSFMPKPVVQDTATTTPQQTNQQPQAVNDLPTQPNDASDAAMAQDAAAVDAQMQALSSDSTTVNGSLNDKPVSQEF